MNEPTKQVEEIKSTDVGSMEEVFGKNGSMFQNDVKEVKVKEVDLTGSQEVEENVTPEDFGKAEAEKVEVEPKGTAIEIDQDIKDFPEDIPIDSPDAGTGEDGFNDHRLSTVKPEKEYLVETAIEYLFNPNNKKIFPVNKDIVKQKDLVPCTKEGKILPDTRRPSDFR